MDNVYAYVRVSTIGQKLEVQTAQIRRFVSYRNDMKLIKVFEDKASGKNTNRPGFTEMIEALETNPHEIKLIIIPKLDRMGRNLRDLLNIVEWLQKRDIGLVSIADNIDTTTHNGRLFFHISAAFAEYELATINERIAAGKLAALEKGVKFGRKPINIPIAEVERLIATNVPLSAIARKFGVSRTTIYRKLDEHNQKKEVI